jgi:hypothetical protein
MRYYRPSVSKSLPELPSNENKILVWDPITGTKLRRTTTALGGDGVDAISLACKSPRARGAEFRLGALRSFIAISD